MSLPWRRQKPVKVVLEPTNPLVSDAARKYRFVTRAMVKTSDGRLFRGTLGVESKDMTMFAITGSNVVLARDLTSADVGNSPGTVTATENGVSVSATFTLTITAVNQPQTPTSVTMANAVMTLPDNSPTGTVVSAFTVGTSDGQPFAGQVSVSGPA